MVPNGGVRARSGRDMMAGCVWNALVVNDVVVVGQSREQKTKSQPQSP